MNSYLLRNLSGITSASIEKYLLFTGWVRDDTFNSTRMWVFKSKSDPEFKIAVPASEKATDFYPQVYNLIQTLSVVDGKTEQEIIDSLKSAYTDRLQFRIITEESQGGKLPLDYAARCLEGLKDLVLYAACAEENAKPICARTYNSAKRALEKFQFGQTQIGSFIINIDVQVADEENEQLYLIDAGAPPDEPLEHKIIKRIGTAITQVDSVANRQIKIGDLIENAYRDGITANMCDALSKLKPENTEDVTVETSVYYAEALTQTVSPPKVFSLDNSHFLFIDEISKRYKDCTLVEDVTLKGTIKMLSKSPSAGGDEEENTVRLLTKIDGQMRSISLHLPPDEHALACNAYRDDKEVCISGTIDKSGKYWFFTEVTEFTVI